MASRSDGKFFEPPREPVHGGRCCVGEQCIGNPNPDNNNVIESKDESCDESFYEEDGFAIRDQLSIKFK